MTRYKEGGKKICMNEDEDVFLAYRFSSLSAEEAGAGQKQQKQQEQQQLVPVAWWACIHIGTARPIYA